MKKKREKTAEPKKLSVKRQKVRILTGQDMANVQGGRGTCTPMSWPTSDDC